MCASTLDFYLNTTLNSKNLRRQKLQDKLVFMFLQNNPAQARTMLLQNPQLAYALLQAQVVMRIVDPATACVSF